MSAGTRAACHCQKLRTRAVELTLLPSTVKERTTHTTSHAGPTSPSQSIHSPPTTSSNLPKIKLNVRTYSRASSAASSSRARSSASHQRRPAAYDDDSDSSSSSDLTPPEDDDDNDDNDVDDDDFAVARTKTRKRESLGAIHASVKDKGKGKAPQTSPEKRLNEHRGSTSNNTRPTTTGPRGRDRKREIKLGEVARRRARDDKFGFGGDRFDDAVSFARVH